MKQRKCYFSQGGNEKTINKSQKIKNELCQVTQAWQKRSFLQGIWKR